MREKGTKGTLPSWVSWTANTSPLRAEERLAARSMTMSAMAEKDAECFKKIRAKSRLKY